MNELLHNINNNLGTKNGPSAIKVYRAVIFWSKKLLIRWIFVPTIRIYYLVKVSRTVCYCTENVIRYDSNSMSHTIL